MARIAKLEKAYRENPDTPLFARLADSYLERGSISEAQKMCEEGCERFPDYPTGFTILSKCYEAQEKLEDARMAMDRALRLDPDNPGGYVRLSQIYESLGISTLALKSLQKASALDPFNDSLSEQLVELADAVEDDPAQVEDQDSVTADGDGAELVAADTGTPDPETSAFEPLPDIDLLGAAQSGIEDYPEEQGVSLPADNVAQQETYDPLITMATDLTAPPATDQEAPLELALTSLDLGAAGSTPELSDAAPDLLLENAVQMDEIEGGTIPTDEEVATEVSADLGIETFTLDEVDRDPPNAQELVDLSAAIFGDADDGESVESEVVESPLAVAGPAGAESTLQPGSEDGDVDFLAFSQNEVTFESEDPDLGAADLISFETEAPSEVEEIGESPSPSPPAADLVSESSSVEAVELISFETEADPVAQPQESGGAVELISFDDQEWDDPEPGVEPAGDPTAATTDATLFEFEAQDVVAAARSGPEDKADVVDLFQEIEGHPSRMEGGSESADLDGSAEQGGGATETLAQIYASQGLIQRAIDTYRLLLEQEPDNERLRQQLAELEQRSQDSA